MTGVRKGNCTLGSLMFFSPSHLVYHIIFLYDKINSKMPRSKVSLCYCLSLPCFWLKLYDSPSLWHCVLCQLHLELALITGTSSVRTCYVRWRYIVIFAANVRTDPLKCLQFKKVSRDEVETRASRLSGITVVLISVCEHHSAGIV